MKPDSALAMNVVLLFLLTTMGGSLWFLLPTRESLEQARRAQSDAAAAGAAVRGNQPAVDPAARWRAQLASEESDLQSLRQTEDRMGKELAHLVSNSSSELPTIPPDTQDPRELAQILAIRRAELETLRLTANVVQFGGDRPLRAGGHAATEGKEPVWLQLYSGRVLPVDDRYYSVRTIDAAGIAFRVLRRTSAGETFEEATADGSKLQLALAGIAPQKQYLRCLVADDSFDLLRGIMTLAAEKSIGLEWDPFKDEDGRIVFTPRQAGGFTTPR
jgi:hypothetical protein